MTEAFYCGIDEYNMPNYTVRLDSSDFQTSNNVVDFNITPATEILYNNNVVHISDLDKDPEYSYTCLNFVPNGQSDYNFCFENLSEETKTIGYALSLQYSWKCIELNCRCTSNNLMLMCGTHLDINGQTVTDNYYFDKLISINRKYAKDQQTYFMFSECNVALLGNQPVNVGGCSFSFDNCHIYTTSNAYFYIHPVGLSGEGEPELGILLKSSTLSCNWETNEVDTSRRRYCQWCTCT